MDRRVPAKELEGRLDRFRYKMGQTNPDWEIAVLFSKINQYYFTGTIQDGMLMILRDGGAVYWVRRSYDRAMDESLFPNIKPMRSFRDASSFMKKIPSTVYMEKEVVPLALYERFQKHFPFVNVRSLDRQVMATRSIKSEYEISIMEKAGEIHRRILEDMVPDMLQEGMSEIQIASNLFSLMIEEGHHGGARFGMFDTDIGLGHVAIGESSIYPTYFDGPGGNYGMGAFAPFWGSRDKILKNGELVYIDVAFGMEGYHTDKTMTYMFGGQISDEAIREHNKCVEIQKDIALMLKPGAIPLDIYRTIMDNLSPEFQENFMGYGDRKVKFFGHGIGLQVDEFPVIAEGFSQPLEEGMVIALEPKKGIKSVGMVGIENTFMVTPKGGRSITGNSKGLIPVK